MDRGGVSREKLTNCGGGSDDLVVVVGGGGGRGASKDWDQTVGGCPLPWYLVRRLS